MADYNSVWGRGRRSWRYAYLQATPALGRGASGKQPLAGGNQRWRPRSKSSSGRSGQWAATAMRAIPAFPQGLVSYGKPAFRANAQPEFRASTQPAFRANAQPAFRANTQPALRTNANPAFRANTQPALRTNANPAIRANTQPAFRASTQPALRANGQPAFRTNAQPAIHTDPPGEQHRGDKRARVQRSADRFRARSLCASVRSADGAVSDSGI